MAKITVVGTGYVGLSNAILFAQHNEVRALEVVEEKVNLINQKKSPIVDKEIEEFKKRFFVFNGFVLVQLISLLEFKRVFACSTSFNLNKIRRAEDRAHHAKVQ